MLQLSAWAMESVENILGVLILKLWERVIRMEVNFESPSLPQYPEIYQKVCKSARLIGNLILVKFRNHDSRLEISLEGNLFGGFHGSKVIIKGSTT